MIPTDLRCHQFIHDEEQVKQFVRLLSPLKEDEVYFVSMSARNKYLTEDERKEYSLGRTEMFARELVKPSSRIEGGIVTTYLRVLKSMQVSEGGYTSRVGKTLPDKCLVVYANINPSSGVDAVREFQEEMMNSLFDLRSNKYALTWFAHANSKLLNCFQRNTGTRKWIDIDFDIPEEGICILHKFLGIMKEKQVEYHIIKTKSGFHILLNKNTISFNYNLFVESANTEAINLFGTDHIEVMVNKNGMVPVPGTMQGGFKVHFLEEST